MCPLPNCAAIPFSQEVPCPTCGAEPYEFYIFEVCIACGQCIRDCPRCNPPDDFRDPANQDHGDDVGWF